MSKRAVFTTVTRKYHRLAFGVNLANNAPALEPGITRETVLQTLHDHLEMIDLNRKDLEIASRDPN